MKRRIICISAVLILAGVFLIKISGEKKNKKKFMEIFPRRGEISLTVETNGTIEPRNRLEIKPPIAGRIDNISVAEGDNVKKGEIVAWMSSTERATLLD
ncbi:MAG: efflux RND transporter periplasmic adaptor subunit, partial [Elusimicrobia bacterium]|nr:efflux RND transporter periplasmic adaptor subunit [Elusimicrobiota bacterium]